MSVKRKVSESSVQIGVQFVTASFLFLIFRKYFKVAYEYAKFIQSKNN